MTAPPGCAYTRPLLQNFFESAPICLTLLKNTWKSLRLYEKIFEKSSPYALFSPSNISLTTK